jgi:naphthalene 1,2-dioxygenase ferredoxin component
LTEPEWIDVAAVADVPVDEVAGVQAHGLDLALFNVDGVLYATDNLCTHGRARLCDGFLEGHEIECPLHQGRFDVRDGRALCAPLTQALRTYSVKVCGDRVHVSTG